MYLVFTRMPGESYRRRLRSLLLYLCYVFRALINSLVCWFCTSALDLVLFQIRFFLRNISVFIVNYKYLFLGSLCNVYVDEIDGGGGGGGGGNSGGGGKF